MVYKSRHIKLGKSYVSSVYYFLHAEANSPDVILSLSHTHFHCRLGGMKFQGRLQAYPIIAMASNRIHVMKLPRVFYSQKWVQRVDQMRWRTNIKTRANVASILESRLYTTSLRWL